MYLIYDPDIYSIFKKYTKSAVNAIESNWISNYGLNIKRRRKIKKNIKY